MNAWLKENRALVVVLTGTALVLLLVVLLAGRGQQGAPHDPDNPGARGSRALANVLEEQGISVTVARSADAFAGIPVDEETTVLVTSPDNLGRSTADDLLAHAADGRVVVAGLAPAAIELLGVDAQAAPAGGDETIESACSDKGIAPLDDVSIRVDLAAAYATNAGCFGSAGGYLLASASPRLTVLGAPGILENDQILRADNAAVALRLLGRDQRLVWYVPSLGDLRASDGVSLRAMLPRWLEPAVLLAGLAMLTVMLWRGRRLGALAREPLPVTVRALETTQARGRLYRSARDPGHAAAALRESTRQSLRQHLALSAVSGAELTATVAARLGRNPESVAWLIDETAPPPRTDDELIRLAADLAGLEQEVRER